jgi:alkylated DNA repair dioxygenase AlkB
VPQQLSMFGSPPAMPEGLRYVPGFVPPEMEQDLIARIQTLPLQPFQFGQFEGKRRVASFGHRYDYSLRRMEPAEPIPSWLAGVVADIECFGGPSTAVGQVLCTEYDVGVGIGWHRDRPQYDQVFGLSLGSSCKFRFRRSDASSWKRFTLDAEPRSLYLMSGASRRIWEHSIPAVEAMRYSITFRTMVEGTANLTAVDPASSRSRDR